MKDLHIALRTYKESNPNLDVTNRTSIPKLKGLVKVSPTQPSMHKIPMFFHWTGCSQLLLIWGGGSYLAVLRGYSLLCAQETTPVVFKNFCNWGFESGLAAWMVSALSIIISHLQLIIWYSLFDAQIFSYQTTPSWLEWRVSCPFTWNGLFQSFNLFSSHTQWCSEFIPGSMLRDHSWLTEVRGSHGISGIGTRSATGKASDLPPVLYLSSPDYFNFYGNYFCRMTTVYDTLSVLFKP